MKQMLWQPERINLTFNQIVHESFLYFLFSLMCCIDLYPPPCCFLTFMNNGLISTYTKMERLIYRSIFSVKMPQQYHCSHNSSSVSKLKGLQSTHFGLCSLPLI